MATATSVPGKRGPETSNPGRNPAAVTATVGPKRGIDLLHDPVLNKATAYTEAERQALGLVGSGSGRLRLRRATALRAGESNLPRMLRPRLGGKRKLATAHSDRFDLGVSGVVRAFLWRAKRQWHRWFPE